MMSATYEVTGLTCGHCVRALGEELTNLAGVRAAAVDLVPGGVSVVTLSSDEPVDTRAVKAALAEAGDYRLAGSQANEQGQLQDGGAGG
jgi:copper chaperone CopZ